MTRTLVICVTVALVFSAAAAAAFWNGKAPAGCDRLLPKGGGTAVHGVFVPLDAGETLLLCKARP